MGRSSEPEFPLSGWRWISVSDSQSNGLSYDKYPNCEFCGHAHLRYVHTLKHPDFPGSVAVGCNCAQRLTGDDVSPYLREHELRTCASARDKFPYNRAWRGSPSGDIRIHFEGHEIIIVKLSETAFRLQIDGRKGTITYSTRLEAQYRAFDVVQQRNRKGEH